MIARRARKEKKKGATTTTWRLGPPSASNLIGFSTFRRSPQLEEFPPLACTVVRSCQDLLSVSVKPRLPQPLSNVLAPLTSILLAHLPWIVVAHLPGFSLRLQTRGLLQPWRPPRQVLGPASAFSREEKSVKKLKRFTPAALNLLKTHLNRFLSSSAFSSLVQQCFINCPLSK